MGRIGEGRIHTSSYLETSTFFLFSSVATCILVNKEDVQLLGNSMGIIGWNSFSHEARTAIGGIIGIIDCITEYRFQNARNRS
jgi:hypothetical protein